MCLWQRLSRQTSWVRGLCCEPQTASGSSCTLAEGLALLQATDLFLHPFPQVREHCPGRQGAATSKESIRPSPGGPTAGPARLGENPALQSLEGVHWLPPPTTLPHLPLPRARCSRWVGSSESGRPVGWRAWAADTSWLPPAPTHSGPVVCTGRAGSECPHHTSGCRCSSSPLTNWEETKTPR